MDRRRFVCSLVLLPLGLSVGACGDATSAPVATGETTVPSSTIPHPAGADDIVLKITNEGGLVPPDYLSFYVVPQLLVTGDGRAFRATPVPGMYPGPLLPNVSVEQSGENGIQALLADAELFGLLSAPPDYSGAENKVADASTTEVTINVDGQHYVHSAYALGVLEPESGARKNLQDAVNRLMGEGDPGETFVATSYRLRARVVDPSALTLADQPNPPTIVDWPDGTGVELATASDCARVAASAVGTLFIDAKQNTYFSQHGVVYALMVRGVLPGDPDC